MSICLASWPFFSASAPPRHSKGRYARRARWSHPERKRRDAFFLLSKASGSCSFICFRAATDVWYGRMWWPRSPSSMSSQSECSGMSKYFFLYSSSAWGYCVLHDDVRDHAILLPAVRDLACILGGRVLRVAGFVDPGVQVRHNQRRCRLGCTSTTRFAPPLSCSFVLCRSLLCAVLEPAANKFPFIMLNSRRTVQCNAHGRPMGHAEELGKF